MNKLILSVFMLFAVSKSNGQNRTTLLYIDTTLSTSLKADTTSWGSIYWRESAKPIYDTVPVIFQYSDTSCHGFCPVFTYRGYAVKKYEPYIYYSTTSNYNDRLWITTAYLTQTKKPIPANWVVWMALETTKPNNQ